LLDEKLLEDYAAAVHARLIIRFLPDGLREYSERYEELLLDDIRRQSGNLTMTGDDALQQAKPTVNRLLKEIFPIVAQITLVIMQKKWPTAAATSFVSAALTYLAAKWGG